MNDAPADSDAVLDQALHDTARRHEVRHVLTLDRPWRSEPDQLELKVSYRISTGADGRRIEARVGGHSVYLDEPVLLEPVQVDKPWGREIWLSGIEARGECGVRSGAGVLPLSQYLALAPRRLTRGAPLVLLKILDPLPQPVLGELYFETHEHKQEVYVVTHVDPAAWPDGVGAIRFGMNQQLRRQYDDDEAFRRDYLAAVQAYEKVRRAIDEGAAGSTSHAPAAREADLRDAMNAFTELRSLRVGDVVVVPTWLPHSLQHGVRVIEFQTPTYERYIISFAQQVVTQDHWDSATAIARMDLDSPAPPVFDRVAQGVERIVAFDGFRVWRVELPAGEAFRLPSHPSYALCAAVSGSLRLGELALGVEQAAFVPAAALDREQAPRLRNTGRGPAIALIAAPDL